MTPTFEPQPRVRLVRAFPRPFESVLTSARTCYSGRGVVLESPLDERDRRLAQSLYEAGHHTTFQHAYFQFALENVSRLLAWSFLHSHPFYNSEQVSQRYVAVRRENFLIPPLTGPLREHYVTTVEGLMVAYERLTDLLRPIAEAAYYRRFPGRRYRPEKYGKAIQKKAQEVARYVLPLATTTYLYHTVSALTLLRYWKTCRAGDIPTEQALVADQMVRAVLEYDPHYEWVLEAPMEPSALSPWPIEGRTWPPSPEARAFVREFDAALDGRISRLVATVPAAETVLAAAVRSVLGFPASALSDDEAIALVLDPARNPALGESLNVTTHLKLTRALYHVQYTFQKKLSHTADAQDQRHRMTPASRPVIWSAWTGEPDYVVPVLVEQDEAARRFYDDTMAWLFERVADFLRRGGPPEYAAYLLPNAYPVRFYESGDLLNMHHKLAMRLCYNAQEEIWRASLEEWRQIADVHPRIGRYLGPPCLIRWMARTKPFCPEGERFCGIRVWELTPAEYERVI